MTKSYDVAILGATGAVGESLLEILAEQDFPIRKLYPLGSERSQSNTVMFRNKPLAVQDVETFDFNQVQIAFFFSWRGRFSQIRSHCWARRLCGD